MREYSKITPDFWIGPTGRQLRASMEAQIVALYLLTSPHANALGLYYLPLPLLAHETGLGTEGASKGLRGCIEANFCGYDEAAEIVWVFEMARTQLAESLKAEDKRAKWAATEYHALPENRFLGAFFDRYRGGFHLKDRRGDVAPPEPDRRGSEAPSEAHRRDSEAPPEPHRSQEQEQKQEQKQEHPPTPRRGVARPTDDRFEVFWGAYPVKANKLDARKAWGKLSEIDREAALLGVVVYAEVWGRVPKEHLRFAGHSSKWLRNERWKEAREVWESQAAPRGGSGGHFAEPSFRSEGPEWDEIRGEVL